MYLHIVRGILFVSALCNMTLWTSGIIIFILIITVSFIGYVLTWGQISFWGSTVIFSFICILPNICSLIHGSFYVCNSTLVRLFMFHLIISLVSLMFSIIHLFYIHYLYSSNPLAYNHNNTLTIFPSIIIKDIFGIYLFGICFTLQLSLGYYSLAHVDNNIEVYDLNTPTHIVPEWYFLCFYAILKTVPSKNLGFVAFLI